VRLIPAVLGAVGVALTASASAAPRAADVAVSRLSGAQVEPAIAIDPRDSRILLAGSNSFREGSMRVYSSFDGGTHWSAGFVYPRPATFLQSCASDPGVAIDRSGRQYFSFIRTTPCRTGHPQLYVAARAGPRAAWRPPVLVSPLQRAAADDKPAIAVDTASSSAYRGRVYVAWSRLSHNQTFDVVLSSSADGGRTWSRPARVSRTGDENTYSSVAASTAGNVYVAWDDASTYSLKIARSTDGGAHFGAERKAASFSIVPIPHCGSGTIISAQPFTCAHANPIVAVDASRGQRRGAVYVSYVRTNVTGVEGVFVTAFDSRLRLVRGSATSPPTSPVAPSSVASDRFWPQSAVDPSNGALWICFYDTRGDRSRRRAFFSCTASTDGGQTWRRLVRAASVASDETQSGADVRQYGDYEGLAVANGVAHPIWTDSRDLRELGEEIYTRRLTLDDLR
jgi:hypothetical protein